MIYELYKIGYATASQAKDCLRSFKRLAERSLSRTSKNITIFMKALLTRIRFTVALSKIMP